MDPLALRLLHLAESGAIDLETVSEVDGVSGERLDDARLRAIDLRASGERLQPGTGGPVRWHPGDGGARIVDVHQIDGLLSADPGVQLSRVLNGAAPEPVIDSSRPNDTASILAARAARLSEPGEEPRYVAELRKKLSHWWNRRIRQTRPDELAVEQVPVDGKVVVIVGYHHLEKPWGRLIAAELKKRVSDPQHRIEILEIQNTAVDTGLPSPQSSWEITRFRNGLDQPVLGFVDVHERMRDVGGFADLWGANSGTQEKSMPVQTMSYGGEAGVPVFLQDPYVRADDLAGYFDSPPRISRELDAAIDRVLAHLVACANAALRAGAEAPGADPSLLELWQDDPVRAWARDALLLAVPRKVAEARSRFVRRLEEVLAEMQQLRSQPGDGERLRALRRVVERVDLDLLARDPTYSIPDRELPS